MVIAPGFDTAPTPHRPADSLTRALLAPLAHAPLPACILPIQHQSKANRVDPLSHPAIHPPAPPFWPTRIGMGQALWDG